MIDNKLEAAAERLRDAYHAGPVEPLGTWLDHTDVTTAYRIQDLNTRHWEREGRRIVGRKIGLTSQAVQQQLGVDQPDYGILFDDTAYTSGADIDVGRLLQPRAEVEVAFVLERDLTDPELTREMLIDAVAYVTPAIEIADSRIRDWRITLVDTIADNASAGVYVVGEERVAVDQVDLAAAAMTLTRNGEPESTGTGAACLGHPLNAVQWLARKMIEHERPLRAGDLVLSGALGPMIAVHAGDLLRAEIAGLGTVAVSFSRDTGPSRGAV